MDQEDSRIEKMLFVAEVDHRQDSLMTLSVSSATGNKQRKPEGHEEFYKRPLRPAVNQNY